MIADELATTLLASAPFAGLFSGKSLETIITWVVFVLCLFFSLLGIGASFLIFGPSISGYRLWGIALVIAIGMISLSYGQKYTKLESRNSFTPVDLISYVLQGFLWPTTWPTLAHVIGISSQVTPPVGPKQTMLDVLVSFFS
jgi:hypothetical protein